MNMFCIPNLIINRFHLRFPAYLDNYFNEHFDNMYPYRTVFLGNCLHGTSRITLSNFQPRKWKIAAFVKVTPSFTANPDRTNVLYYDNKRGRQLFLNPTWKRDLNILLSLQLAAFLNIK